jgi:hypothetical protein
MVAVSGQDGDLAPQGAFPHGKTANSGGPTAAGQTARGVGRIGIASLGSRPSSRRGALERMVTRSLASVHVENFSGHESRRIQVHHRIHDIGHFPHSTHRMQ